MSDEIEPVSSSISGSAGEKGTGAAAGANQELPITVYNGNDRYTLANLIGKANGIPVYEASYNPEDMASAILYQDSLLRNVSVAIQIVHEANQEEEHDHLLEEILRNKHCNHDNILRIKKNFSCNGSLCVVMPLDEVQSLRNIMASTPIFNNGLPENCIAVALRETLYGLDRVHQMQEVHKKISAGNIFFHEKSSSIKLAYAASIYELNSGNDQASSSWELSINSICRWSAAPEVYETDHDPEFCSEKSDIWLIGIAALELAYGNLKFECREQLEDLAEEIMVNRRLPNKGEQLNFDGEKKKGKKMVKFIRENMQMPDISFPGKSKKKGIVFLREYDGDDEEKKKGKKVMNFMKRNISLQGKKKKSSFSKSFGKMVAECLAMDPKKRPNVVKLLQHEFFKDSRTVKYFENVVVKQSVNPVW